MYTVKLKQGKEKRALYHPWVYANEVESISDKGKQGSVAKVVSHDNRLVGYGFINHLSKILIRFVSRKDEDFGLEFFEKKIEESIEKRKLLGFDSACRLIFGESDGLPGLIVDKYADCLSVQFLCLGMDLIKKDIVNILVKLLNPVCVYERSDSPVREKEGLTPQKGVLYGTLPEKVVFEENGLKLFVDIADGQKTGYFLDQKKNRQRFGSYANGRDCLDCFSNVGGFALNAGLNGAKSVLALDISELAVQSIQQNAKLNNLENIETECVDVFERLRTLKADGRKFDLICLDPPAFIKSKDSIKSGYSGYKDINICGLKLLKKNGIMFTCSCSQHLTLDMFLSMIRESAIQSGSDVSLLEFFIQSEDHACNVLEEEALYLKVAVLRKNN